MNLFEFKAVHFIGIGGIGVSAIAKILLEKKILVSGSDQSKSQLTEELSAIGAKVSYEHKSTNVQDSHELVIYSPAVPETNPEVIRAKELGLPILSYPQALGLLTETHFTIAVAGTHGKSTTTAMISVMLENSGFDPTVVIGTKINEFKSQNYRVGKSKFLVIEACEYKDSFLEFEPNILVVTNLEPDHLDYFKTAENYYNSYLSLANKLSTNDLLISEDTKICRKLFSNLECKVVFVSKLI